MASPVSLYLACYNALVGLGWLSVALLVVKTLWEGGEYREAFSAAADLTAILQLVSLLETLHAALGIVKSGVLANILQWVARSHAFFIAVQPQRELHGTFPAVAMLVAWGLGETCRYPWCVNIWQLRIFNAFHVPSNARVDSAAVAIPCRPFFDSLK
jgi:very-long-chain (3R)-3-hydroxyacyl-CoA dehydratase